MNLPLIFAASIAASSVASSLYLDDPVALGRTETCMLKVLKGTPDVANIVSQKPPKHMDDTQPYPFVAYNFKGYGVSFFVTKVYVADHISYYFTAALSGLYNGSIPPSDNGTGAIEKTWKARCGAIAVTVFV